jgi:hypothetical protein
MRTLQGNRNLSMLELYLLTAHAGLREIPAHCAALLRPFAGAILTGAPATVEIGRDRRLDLFRGMALWFIFLDHIPGNVFSWITVRNYGFSDATEIFVFISGYTVALVYGKTMRRDGLVEAGARILKRAWQIYVAHVFVFVIYAATIALLAAYADNGSLIEKMGLREFFQQPGFMLLQVLALRFKPANMDVLPMYVAVLIAFAPMLWLLVRRPNLALIGAIAFYVLARTCDWNMGRHGGGGWYFNPFAWQLLFMIGAWCALGGAERVAGLIRSRLVGAIAAAYLLFAFAIAMTWRVPALAEWVPAWLGALIYPIDKPNLDLLRLAHFLALLLLTVRLIGRDQPALNAPALRPLALCGMHSLEIFCLGVLLSFVAHVALMQVGGTVIMHVVASVAGIAIMSAAAGLIAWGGTIEAQKDMRQLGAGDAAPSPFRAVAAMA